MLGVDVLERVADVGGDLVSGVSTCSVRWLMNPTATFFVSLPLYGSKSASGLWPASFDSIVQTSAFRRLR